MTHKAGQEKWQQRDAEMEERAREAADEKLQETLEEMNVRHLELFARFKATEASGITSGATGWQHSGETEAPDRVADRAVVALRHVAAEDANGSTAERPCKTGRTDRAGLVFSAGAAAMPAS